MAGSHRWWLRFVVGGNVPALAGLGAGVADTGSGMGGVALRHLGTNFNGFGLFFLLPVHVFRFTVLSGGAHP